MQVTEQRVHDVHFPLASSLLRAHLLQADHVVDFFCVAKLNHHKRIRLRGGSDHTASNSFTESSSPPAKSADLRCERASASEAADENHQETLGDAKKTIGHGSAPNQEEQQENLKAQEAAVKGWGVRPLGEMGPPLKMTWDESLKRCKV